MLGFFEKTGEILAKCWDFFQKLLGFLKKVGKFLQNVGIFGRKLWWGQVGIFDTYSGDLQPGPSGNTARNKRVRFRQRNFNEIH